MTDIADLDGGAPLASGNLELGSLLVAAAETVVLAETQSALTNNYHPTDGRVAVATGTDTVYVGDGSAWQAVQSAVGLDGLVRLARYSESTLPSASDEGRLAYNTDRSVPTFENGSEWEVPVVGNNVNTSANTVANTTTETTVWTGTLVADSMKAGRVYEIFLYGKYSTNDSSDTFDLKIKVAGTTVATITSTAANVSDTPISIKTTITVRSEGASGTIIPHTSATFDNADKDVHHGTETIDTTVANDLKATVTWGVAESGNSVTIGQGYLKEVS